MKKHINSEDRISFEDTFRWLFGELCHFSFTFIHDFKQCEDIVQDVFVKYWKVHNKFLNAKASKAWLYKAVKNKCIDHLRSQKTIYSIQIELLELISNDTPPDFSEDELQSIKQKYFFALKELPERTSKVFVMNREEFKSYSDIAQELDLSVKAVEYHISRALRFLKKHLKEYLVLFFNCWPLY